MNFVKRAWLNLLAKKGRSALLILVTSAIMLFVLAGLLIKNAAATATQQAKDSVGATLTLSTNREAAFKQMRQATSTSGGKPSMPKLTTSPVSLSTAKKIAKLNGVSSYSATVSTSANAKGFDAIETSSASQGFGGKMPGTSSTSGDITISGVTSTASNSSFTSGSDKITAGRGLKATDANSNNVVIETNLAKANDLKVGSTIRLKATTGTKKTYTLKVVGIYKAKATTTAGPGQSDPANTVFTATTLANTFKGSKYVGTADSVTFNVTTPSQVAAVKKAAKQLINTEKYSISADDASYQMVKSSMKSVTGFANKIVWLVVIAGTIILALIVILMIRERRYEIGVLLSLGESRMKIIAQFFVELLVVLVIGVGVASAGGKFVGDKLASQVVSAQTTSTTSSTGQMGQGQPGGAGGAQGNQPGGQMGDRSQALSTQKQKQTKLETQVTPQVILLLIAVGLLIIFIAILIGAGGILRLQPKKVLIG